MTQWHVTLAPEPINQEGGTSSVPLKWAHDAQTGEPRYIHDPEVVSRAVEYTCPACNLALTPVLAGQPMRVRPTAHFRHPTGAQRDACIMVAARAAAVHFLRERGFIDLPRRALLGNAKGFSGQDYQVWVEEPAERVHLSTARMRDHATAVLTLDDGRELLVDLTGLRAPSPDDRGTAIVTMALSDPSLATMDADAIRARLRLLPDLRWCSHWSDGELGARSSAAAARAAVAALDAWSPEDEAAFLSSLPMGIDDATAQGYRRETLLHREVKTLLGDAESIETPGLELSVTRDPPEEISDDCEDGTICKLWRTDRRRLELASVQLERKLGRIVPDVIAILGGRQIYTEGGTLTKVGDESVEDTEDDYSLGWPEMLLIEVKVTHGIDEEKLRRIRELNLPVLEIDLSVLGGRISREQLRDLVVNQVVGKRWINHPSLSDKRVALESEIDTHPVNLEWAQRLQDRRRRHWLALPVDQWSRVYVAEATKFHEKSVQIQRAQRSRKAGDAVLMPPSLESADWRDLVDAADALAEHGLPGGMDSVMIDGAGLVSRILSIRHNRGIGYAVDSGFQVLNAIMQSGKRNRQWSTLYAIAVKAYDLARHFSARQAETYEGWRQLVIERVKANDAMYLRPETYDPILSALFPDMASGIATGYGVNHRPPS